MATLKNVSFAYGDISYRNEIPETETTSETQGNVTINNMGKPGVATHFECSVMLDADFEEEGVSVRNIFHWKTVVTGYPADATYLEVDAEAARRIAPMLRDVAAEVEKQVADYDAQLAAKQEGS